jgi:hypothetical protein
VALASEILEGSYWAGDPGDRGVVHRVGQESIEVSIHNEMNGDALIGVADTDLALDLTDATGRAHAAWWLAGVQPAYHHPRHSPIEDAGVAFVAGSYGWCLTGMHNSHLGWGWRRHPGGQHVGPMPPGLACLTDLDPNDDRLIPGGSRWVDAEALRRVCLHVAGVTRG